MISQPAAQPVDTSVGKFKLFDPSTMTRRVKHPARGAYPVLSIGGPKLSVSSLEKDREETTWKTRRVSSHTLTANLTLTSCAAHLHRLQEKCRWRSVPHARQLHAILLLAAVIPERAERHASFGSLAQERNQL